MADKVNLVVSVYERTYRNIFASNFLSKVEADCKFSFNKKILVVNNVVNRKEVEIGLLKLIDNREVDEFYFVEDYIEKALNEVGLEAGDLEPLPYFSNWALVALYVSDAPWFLHWDSEVHLMTKANWIARAIDIMNRDQAFIVANPNWNKPTLCTERRSEDASGNYAEGYGFSDQVFLCRKHDLLQPIYKESCPISLRFPLSHLTSVFEQRVDAYMRNHQKKRLTITNAQYFHPTETEGSAYPKISLMGRLKFLKKKIILSLCKLAPITSPRYKL